FPSNEAGCSHRPAGGRTLRRSVATTSWFADVIPPFVICGAMLLLMQHMTPHSWIAGAANARNYLITQPYVSLLYLKTFFWPSGLSADYDLNPFTTTDDARFWVGFVFISLFTICAIAFSVSKKTRVIGFGLLWFLIALLSTSALPLAEPMNDHRTFFPYIGLVIAIAGAMVLLVARLDRSAKGRIRRGEQSTWPKTVAVCAVVMFLCANGYATFQRNKVWKD